LQQELPGLRGFSGKNISKMRAFYKAWNSNSLICSSLTSKLEKQTIELSSSVTSTLEIPAQTRNITHDAPNLNAFISVSFTSHYEIILKTKDEIDRWYYIQQAALNFWTVRHLRTELNNKSHLTHTNLSNNFNQVLPEEISNKAIRAFKDQYLLDYVNIEDADDEIDECVLEREIVLNIKKFLMALGRDFSFMGNQ
jgi:predicted nuclease of restriction endonuclease-like (RecB) superfamily